MKTIKLAFLITAIMLGCSSVPKLIEPIQWRSAWGVEVYRDSTYRYDEHYCVASSYSEGNWNQIGDTLFLSSFIKPQIVSIKESCQTKYSFIKILINGSDNNEYFNQKVFLNSVDSINLIKKAYNIEELIDKSENVVRSFYKIPTSKFNYKTDSILFFINDYRIIFTLKDTLTTLVILNLNVSDNGEMFNSAMYFNRRKFIISGDSIFSINANNNQIEKKYPGYYLNKR